MGHDQDELSEARRQRWVTAWIESLAPTDADPFRFHARILICDPSDVALVRSAARSAARQIGMRIRTIVDDDGHLVPPGKARVMAMDTRHDDPANRTDEERTWLAAQPRPHEVMARIMQESDNEARRKKIKSVPDPDA